MDEKKEMSLSRTKEEIALYEPILEVLELDPGEMGHLHIPVLKDMLTRHKRTVECVEKGLPFLASQFTNPVEILTAMDLHWYFTIEQIFTGAGSGGTPHHMEDLEAADRMTVPKDCCTLIRLTLYYAIADLLPIPSAYLALTEPCDSVTGWHAAFMHHPDWRDVPVFVPDPPYHQDERAVEYYAGEMRRMIDFITKHTGKTLDMDRLREVVEETNKQYELWLEYNDIRRSIPAPHGNILGMSCFGMTNCPGAGNPENTPWFKDLIADAEMRVRENKPEVPNQKIRVFWYDILPTFFGEISSWLEQEWGAVVVMDMVGYCPYELIDTSTEDSMLRGLAKRAFQHGPMIHQGRGSVDNVVLDIQRIVKDYKVDCVFFPGHMGHKEMAASASIMRDTCRDLGVPFLHIGMDSMDSRYTTVDEIKGIISQFFTAMGLN